MHDDKAVSLAILIADAFGGPTADGMDDVHASSGIETICQIQPEPFVQETLYASSTLTDPVEQKSKKKNFPGPPKTPEQFWKCGRFESQHIYLNKPCLFEGLIS